MRLILIRVRRADPRGRGEPLRGRPALQGMTIPENRKQRSKARVGIMTAGVNPSPCSADSGFSQTAATQRVESGTPSRSPEAGGGLVNEGRRLRPRTSRTVRLAAGPPERGGRAC